MKNESFLDEIYRELIALEEAINQSRFQNTQLNKRLPNTLSDHIYISIIMEKTELALDLKADAIIQLAEAYPTALIFFLKTNLEFSPLLKEYVYRAISRHHDTWSQEIEDLIAHQLTNSKSSSYQETAANLFCLTDDLPAKKYSANSKFLTTLTKNFSQQEIMVKYTIIRILWSQQYSYDEILQFFRSLTKAQDWRIRVLIHDYLNTWKKMDELKHLKISQISLADRLRKYFSKNLELKILNS